MALRSRLDVTFRTALCVAILLPLLVAVSLAALLLALLRVPRRRIDRLYTGFAAIALRVGGTRVEAHGLENVRPDQSYIVVPNHESNWDPIVLVDTLSRIPVRFIAKKQITRIPVFGWALLRTGNVRVVRTNTPGDVERIRREMAKRPLDVSILFYAEGTRSRDGALHAFKKGAFATAIAYGLPILPIGHAGTYRIWQPLRFGIRRGSVVVEIGPPIPVEDLRHDDRDKLRDRTFETVRELRARARRRLRELGGDPGGID
jgi:1-acyl-sn-glycerol-3-phosphate acyltransferase